MAQIAVAPGIETLAGLDAHAQTLDKLEALSEQLDAALSRRKSNGFLRRTIKNWRQGDIARAGQLALEATQVDGSNGQAYHILAMALERMGHLHKALVTYERAFEIDPNDPDLLLNLGLTAWNLKLIEGAEKMFRLFIAARPHSPLGYNNLGTIQAPVWNGEPLDGKRILVVGEQGLGDEFMFANILPDFARTVGAEGKLQIC